MLTLSQVPQLSYKNHFEFGYDLESFCFRSNEKQKWFARYGKCERPPLSFHDECLETARRIHEQARGPVTVMFSGGVDSEVVLRSFIEARIPVRAAILRFRGDLNIHDISWAVISCEALNVPYHFFELDLLEFWRGQAFEYAKETYCISPQLVSTMWLVDQLDEYPVMGSGECLLVKRYGPDYQPGISPYVHSTWDLWEKEKIAAWFRIFLVRGREGCPGFFQYTPEIMLSYLRDPFVQKLASSQIEGKLSTESSKLAIYQQHFPLVSRPKYTGFEKVQKEDASLRATLTAMFPGTNEIYKTPFPELLRTLAPA